MSKFWTVVTTVFILAVVLLAASGERDTVEDQGHLSGLEKDGLYFTDMETECQYNRGQKSRIDLNQDGSISFEGQYKIENTVANFNHEYRKSDGRIVLDIKASEITPLTTFFDRCKGLVVYDAETQPLEDGVYRVTLKHRGETVQDQIMDIQ